MSWETLPHLECHLEHRPFKVTAAKGAGGGTATLNCLGLSLVLEQAQGPNLAPQEAGRMVGHTTKVPRAVSPMVCLLPIISEDPRKNQKSPQQRGGVPGNGNVLCKVLGTLRVKRDVCLLPLTASRYHVATCGEARVHVRPGLSTRRNHVQRAEDKLHKQSVPALLLLPPPPKTWPLPALLPLLQLPKHPVLAIPVPGRGGRHRQLWRDWRKELGRRESRLAESVPESSFVERNLGQQ